MTDGLEGVIWVMVVWLADLSRLEEVRVAFASAHVIVLSAVCVSATVVDARADLELLVSSASGFIEVHVVVPELWRVGSWSLCVS